MLNRTQAQTEVEKMLPSVTVKAWTVFKDAYLFRVEHQSPLEQDWDPFFSVDNLTGEVRDFSVLTDITADEVSKLKWANI